MSSFSSETIADGKIIVGNNSAYIKASGNDFSDPSKLFLLAGSLADEIDGDTLSVESGGALYCWSPTVREKQAALLNNTSLVYSGANIADYRTPTEMSVALLAQLTDNGSEQVFYSVAGANDNVESNNHQHSLRYYADGRLAWFHESGAGVNNNNLVYAEASVVPGQPFVLGATLDTSGTRVTLYVNGQLSGVTTGLNAPTGGSNSSLRVGAGAAASSKMEHGTVGCLAFLFGDSWSAEEHQAIADLLMVPR